MRLNRNNERRGIIMLVVLSLLTLFAIVGLTFVLYASSEATSARVAREAESMQHADVPPEQALAYFLGQLIYDVPDSNTIIDGYATGGAASAMRGHSLARTMYGYNNTSINVTPYNGVGRLHTNGSTWPFMNSYTTDDYQMVNYTFFQSGMARDPEWYGGAPQATPGAGHNTSVFYVPGNAPYTYPDLNNLFLAAVRSDGTVLAPSFHRNYMSFGTLASSNPNWNNASPQMKYQVLRPRPYEHRNPATGVSMFPLPDDATGDVKNLIWAPGGNDSFWMDLGAPVMTAPDGTMYKMLFAPLIMDLDNRINLAAAGNISLAGNQHASNQGWGPWEVNLSQLWSGSLNAAAWQQMFLGKTAVTFGKYGADKLPESPLFPSGDLPHVYGQADLDGCNEMARNPSQPAYATAPPTNAIQLPGTNAAAPAQTCFPYFPPGYGCGSTAERKFPVAGPPYTWRHPAAYAARRSFLPIPSSLMSGKNNDDVPFRPSDMESLLRPNSQGAHPVDSGSAALRSQLLRLCPGTLGSAATVPQLRNWITTISADLARPGLSPWIFNNPPATPPSYTINAALTPSLAPSGSTIAFPAYAQRSQPLPVWPSSTDFTANWRGQDASQTLGSLLGRVNLNRSLPPFPHMLPPTTNGNPTPGYVAPNIRYDSNPQAITQAQTALQARQTLANDIYRRLLVVTGVVPVAQANLLTPLPTDLAPRRWLAQLAVNIVDYIDADNISTPFNFYTAVDATTPGQPPPAFNIYQVTPTTTTIPAYSAANGVQGNPDVPAYWVFGTELPRIVINEASGEYTLQTDEATPPSVKDAVFNFNVNLWVELFNPMPTSTSVGASATQNGAAFQPLDALPVPLYMPATTSGPAPGPYNSYQLVLANNGETVPALPPPAAAPASAPVPNPLAHGLWYNAAGINNNVLGTPQYQYYVLPTATNLLSAGCNFGLNVPGFAGLVGTVAAPATPTYSIASGAGLYGGLGNPPLVAQPTPPQSAYLLVGPLSTSNIVNNNDVNNDITVAAGVPGATPFLQSPSMTYQVQYTPANPYPWSVTVPPPPGSPANTPTTNVLTFDNLNGVSVLLRRLANPFLPPNPFVRTGTAPALTLLNPAMPPNPYITVDYVHGIELNGYGLNDKKLPVSLTNFKVPPPGQKQVPPTSFGKFQPYAANFSRLYVANTLSYNAQTTSRIGTTNPYDATNNPTGLLVNHTFGLQNAPFATPYTWLVHLDRKLISPMELLHVSGFHPHELTQRFIIPSTIPATPPATGTIPNPQLISQPYNYTIAFPTNSTPFQHYAPWFNQANRLYRIFELLETNDGASGVSPRYGRVPGKININTLWDPPTTYQQIYQAICSPSATPNNPGFTSAQVPLTFNALLTSRTPNLATATLGAADRPFVGMSGGVTPTGDLQYPNGMGIHHTLLTNGQLDATAIANPAAYVTDAAMPRLLQLPNATPTNPQIAHPYMQNELLTKIYNRLTTRSNVFAVFLTVGFFEVTGTVAGSPGIPQLGAEIGRSEGRNVRHRMFAIVDRTQLAAFSTTTSSPIAAAASAWQPTNATIVLNAIGPIAQGFQLVLEPGTANEEVVTVTAVNPSGSAPNTVTANCLLAHPNSAITGNTSSTYQVLLRGNPGPQANYDPRKDPLVVPYFSIID